MCRRQNSRVCRRQNSKVGLIENLDTIMTVLVSVEGTHECGVIVRHNRNRCRVSHTASCRYKRRVIYRVNTGVTSREPVLKYNNSGIPVHLTRPG